MAKADAALETVITTLLVDAVQGAFAMVHCRVADPTTSPVTPELGKLGEVMVAEPEITDQVPIPTIGVLPARVVVVTLQIFWAGPAFAVVGAALTTTATLMQLADQHPVVLFLALTK